MTYFLAPSLVFLRNEVNTRWPNRSKISDGWIGDTAHSARVSDHNPDWRAPGRRRGVVRALDITVRGIDVNLLLRHTTNDSRVAYVIYNRRIYTHSRGWYAYTGSNPHTSHVHVSIAHTATAENTTKPWFGSSQAEPKPEGLSMSDVKKILDELNNLDSRVAQRATRNQVNQVYVRQREYQNETLSQVKRVENTTRAYVNNVYVRQREYQAELEEMIHQVAEATGVTIDYDKVRDAARKGAKEGTQEALEEGLAIEAEAEVTFHTADEDEGDEHHD